MAIGLVAALPSSAPAAERMVLGEYFTMNG
jgi:hypothetical protein